MKITKLLIIPFIFSLTIGCSSSDKAADNEPLRKESIEVKDLGAEIKYDEAPPMLFDLHEIKPKFEGGADGLLKFMTDNLEYTAATQEQGKAERVVTRFVIGKDGSIGDVQTVSGLNPVLNDEVIRVIKTMPNWEAGRLNDEAIPMYYYLLTIFRL